ATPMKAPEEAKAPASDAAAPPREAPPRAEPAKSGTEARRVKRPRAIIMVSALLLATYAALRYADEAAESEPDKAPDRMAEIAVSDAPRREASGPRGITPGSTLGDVYAIQGIPSATQGDTWHYGKSTIRFSQGKVVSWTQHPDNPLRIARDQPIELREGAFSVGSTKDEVRSVQGTPVSETENVWDYGPSRVYFENNRVIGWTVSPLQPLHVTR